MLETATATALGWWANHPPDPAWIAHYAASVDQPHRATVVTALRRLGPWASLFEVGCHCGPMLRAIAREWPDARYGGCDVNAEAVTAAQRWLPSVVCGAFPGVTATAPDGLVDVVLSCYTLAYVPPAEIGAALGEAARLARRAVVLCEPMSWDGRTRVRSEVTFAEWWHPYLSRLSKLPAYAGWTATCERLFYEANFLSGLIVLERP